MLYATSTVSRRLVGRLDRGIDLVQGIIEVCREEGVNAGRLSAQGILTGVDLGLFDIEAGEYVTAFRADGSFELLSLSGSVSRMGDARVIHSHALLAYSAHGHPHLIGGQLRSGTVFAVEFVIESFDDVQLHRGLDEATRLPLLKTVVSRHTAPAAESRPAQPEPSRPEAPAPAPRAAAPLPSREPSPPAPREAPRRPAASATEWQEAARKSKEILAVQTADEPELEEVELEPGDVLLHPRLGECTVVRVDDQDAAYIRIKRSRRVSKLALGLIHLEPVEGPGDSRVFKVIAGQ